MKLTSLSNLIKSDRKNVCRFLLELCREYDYEVTQSEKSLIYYSLIKFSKLKNNNYELFLNNFNDNQELYRILELIGSNNKYGFFTNQKHVYISELDKQGLSLTLYYLNIFGFVNVEN